MPFTADGLFELANRLEKMSLAEYEIYRKKGERCYKDRSDALDLAASIVREEAKKEEG